MHGGTVVAQSDGKGKGTTMTVQLPFPALPPLSALPPPSDPNKSKPDSLHGLTIMVVEDEQDTLSMLGRAVQEYGASVILASSAAEALAQLDHEKPDVLISDVTMRETDGYELIRTIRSGLPPESRDIPAVALSAVAGADDRNRSFQAGYRAHITKPVAVRDLVSILAGLASRTHHDARVRRD
jgi:CheY-like chemotaxis protein